MAGWLGAAALGAVVGLTELITRYRDQPSALLRSISFWIYLAMNAAASAGALALMRVFAWDFGIQDPPALAVTQVLVAGLAAMTLFRSSLFNLRIGADDVAIGPNAVLTSLLNVVDRAVDRRRAADRSKSIVAIMSEVSFGKAKIALPAYCLQLMQNVPREEQEKLRTAVEALGRADMDEDLKSLKLGLLLTNTVGPGVLTAAVRDLGRKIRAAAEG